ncbi:MAG TPA: hypothetical protein VFV49_11240, partial [Thermoanaerobaculia bacterium]|nr:hypothetical protein [Thermoanaerobaculia bacterium]
MVAALSHSPEPLTRAERIAAWVLAVVVAATRWPAVSLTLWDWDEALFALALRDYDVVAHHPHPPGFPLFIALAKLISLDGFHALQSVTVCASLFVFPAMFFLARELRFSALTSMGAALLLAFFPNVWFFGGTAFSDVPSLVLALLASALLLRGCRSDRSLLIGALVLGIAAGFRPQNLLIGFVPLLLAFLHRRRTALLGAAIAGTIVVASYAGAAAFSGGWEAYREALVRHERYIREIDSFLSPTRPGLVQVADDFFLRPYRAPLVNVVISLLAAIGLLRLRKRAALALLIFGPFLLFAWLYLDFHSASRFSIGYMPLYALLAASAIPARALTAVVALLVLWTWPALRIVHTTASPPVAAIEAIRATHDRAVVLYVDERLAAHAALLLSDHFYANRVVRVAPPLIDDLNAILLREGSSVVPGARTFTRDRERLEGIARKRYFEVSVV